MSIKANEESKIPQNIFKKYMCSVECNIYNILVGKPERKKPVRKHRHRLEDIRMDLREMGWESLYWIHLAQDGDQWQALINAVMNIHAL
jgi:hypothetical protein